MAFDLSQIKTVAEADAVLSYANAEKEALELAITLKERDKVKDTTTSVDVAEELAEAQEEVAFLSGRLGTMAEGPRKNRRTLELKRAETKVQELTNRRQNYNLITSMDAQLDLARLEAQLDEIERFITEVMAFKATL